MKKLTIGCALLASLALPGIASAADRHEVREAARECRADREAMGAAEFRSEHRSLGRCIQAKVRENRAERGSARRQAVRDCRERDLSGRDLARCITAGVRAERAEQEAKERAERNAARRCRDERESLGEEAFRAQYGTNSNDRNAFGRCVSSKVAQSEGSEEGSEDGAGRGRPGHAGPPEHAGRPA